MPFIELDRRFRDLTAKELEDPEYLAYLNEREFGSPVDWAQLRRHSRVLLLAEAGSGKTAEMQNQAARLTAEGRYAFFVALESLDREELGGLLSAEDEERLDQWMRLPAEPGWFFLDAVDELKLTSGKLERALRRFARSIPGQLARARVVVSCRPNDWRGDVDMATMKSLLPDQPAAAPAESTGEEYFLEALRRETGQRQPLVSETEVASGAVRTVILLPMSSRQIGQFARTSGITNADSFLAEIGRQNAWTFARRPLDLSELAATWTATGRLGTRREQHEANIRAKLRDDPDRADQGLLGDQEARTGAERLALALALTRTRVLRSPAQRLDPERSAGVLDPGSVLTEWSPQQRQSLMRKALFDPATYGRVRFHHRSVQEYLAACRLRSLRDAGMSVKTVFRLLFAERYGAKVVVPSMRPIAAWLALWDFAVMHELARREPEVLLSMGDPESLDMPARANLLRRFAASYGEGGWRGLDIPTDEVRRLAHSEPAAVVRELWGDGPENPDVQELLIEVIWKGPIPTCADLAEQAAFNAEWGEYHRIMAVRALRDVGLQDIVGRIARSVVDERERWPDRVVRGLITDLFPGTLNVDDLIVLLERTPEPRSTTSGSGWAMRTVAREITPDSAEATSLRNQLADLIWRGRNAQQEFYRIRGRFDHLALPLAILITRQLSAGVPPSEELIRAAVIGNRFGNNDDAGRDAEAQLQHYFRDQATARPQAYWTELALMDELAPSTDPWNRAYHALNEGLLERLSAEDRPWVLEALSDEAAPQRKPVAMNILMDIWVWRGRGDDELAELRRLAGADEALSAIVTARSVPPDDTALRRMRRDDRRHERQTAEREARRLENWQAWRRRLMFNTAFEFCPPLEGVTRENIHSWLSMRGGNTHYNVWDRTAIERGFSTEAADLAAASFRRAWRENPVTLWSAREPAERNSTLWICIYGLCGLASEVADNAWVTPLSSAEARTAAAYATIELNGLSSFIPALAASHPAEVGEVLGDELDAELREAAGTMHLPLLQDISRSPEILRRLLAPRIMAALERMPAEIPEAAQRQWAAHLEHLLRSLADIATERQLQELTALAGERFLRQPSGPVGANWLTGLFRLDAARATQVLAAALQDADDNERTQRAVTFFGNSFGSRDGVALNIAGDDDRARALGQLVRLAHKLVRREQDQRHEGAYSPDSRDHAQQAREYLLSALLETPGQVARDIILELAGEQEFSHFPDRLRLLARRRAAADAEPPAISATDFLQLDTHYELPPGDRDALFRTMMDRLEDLDHDISEHDFTDRRTIRTITDEVEMQRTLSWRLKAMARGAYIVAREEEVADLKRTDIRLSAVRGDQKAVAEVKLADGRWTLRQLEEALRTQLVGQYLRHAYCRAGCLLLTYDGAKRYWLHPESRRRLSFAQIVAHLNAIAADIGNAQGGAVRLAVFGIDLTDPAPAEMPAT